MYSEHDAHLLCVPVGERVGKAFLQLLHALPLRRQLVRGHRLLRHLC